jgi:type VI secretion system protein VasI
LFLALFAASAAAGFVLDVERGEVMKRLGLITVNDLSVGETGYVGGDLCRWPNGMLGIDRYSELESERSEYLTYFKITREPENRVKAEVAEPQRRIVGGVVLGRGKAEELSRVAKSLTKLEECRGEIMLIESIEGASSLAELIELIKRSTALDEKTDPLTSTESPAQEPENNWVITEDKSKLDDSTNVTMMLQSGDEFYDAFGRPVRPSLVIRCKENRTDLYVVTGVMIDSEVATLRLDSEKAFTLRLSKSTSGEALFFPNPIAKIKQFWNHKQLVFRFTPYRSGAQTVTFAISDLSDKIAPLRAACQW